MKYIGKIMWSQILFDNRAATIPVTPVLFDRKEREKKCMKHVTFLINQRKEIEKQIKSDLKEALA